MFLQNNLNCTIDFIIEKKKIKIREDIKNEISLHFFKISFFVRVVVIVSFAILNLFSIIFFAKFFHKITNKNRDHIIKKSSFLFNFLINKSLEVIHALICIHAYNDEKITVCKREKDYKSFYEFIVIGSGPGGSITANILNKNFPNKTLLIEKGEEYSKSNSKHPGNEFKYKWHNGGIASSFFPLQINFSSASCLGGGSEINSGLYHEPDHEFINVWKNKYQTKNLEFENIDKHTQKIKSYLKPSIVKQDNLFEGKFESGAIHTKNTFQYIPRLSYKSKSSKNEATMLNTFLKDYEDQKGEILTGTIIDKIEQLEDGWCVKGYLDKKKFLTKCKYIFLCCGSIYTNSLLLSSLKFKNKNSIKKFNFHPMLKVIAKYPEKVQKINEDVSSLQITSHYPDFIIGSATSSKQFMLASTYDSEKIYFDIQKNWEYMTTFHTTYSFGTGKILKIPFIKEDVYFYNINKSGLELIIKSLNKLCDFIFNTGASEIILISTKSKKIVQKDNYKEIISSFKKIKDFIFSSVHILGGVTMGEANGCTTDSFGKIKEYRNLYINDSSLINNKLLKNPQGTVMSIAYRNIENFVKNYNK